MRTEPMVVEKREARGEAAVLAAEGVMRAFQLADRRLDVLKGVDFQLASGEFVGIVGLSGVGKSTLLHLLGALDRPDAGTLTYRGRDVFAESELGRAAFRNRHVGFVFQFHHLMPEFTAEENVMMPLRLAGRGEGAARRRSRELLDRVGLSGRLDHRPGQLSGGEQQRVAVARALANEPDILLADEPSGNLDPKTGERIYDLLFELRDTLGHSIVVTTHSMLLARRCDRVLELVDGRLRPAPALDGSA